MNLEIVQLKPAVRAAALAALLLASAFSAAAQSTNGTDFASFQIIGQRNIFDPNRVPHRRSVSSVARVVDSFSFVGTMSYAKGNFAFFDGTGPDFRKVLELDGSIADFKITAITAKSVTLVSGTNETILPLGTQMRRDDDGHWVVSSESASYASTGSSFASGSRHGSSGRVGDGSVPAGSTITTDNLHPDGSNPPPPGGGNDALTRLMRQRAQEEQQLGSGQGQ